MYSIQGFGTQQPLKRGIEMAVSADEHYAKDIAKSLAKCYVGQYFGVIDNVTGERHIWIYQLKDVA